MPDDPTKRTRMWAALCHLSALLVLVTAPAGIIPGVNALGPVLIWLTKGSESAFVDDQGKESVNFQMLMTVMVFASYVFVAPIRLAFMCLVLSLDVLLVLIASVKAGNGEAYRYPVPVRLIR